MPITSAQLSSALRVKKEFNLVNGDLTLTDISNWSGLGILAPDEISVLIKILSPTGSIVYQNVGYDVDDYASPDFTLTTTVLNETIPTDVLGNYITGDYTVCAKVLLLQGVNNITTAVTVQVPPSALPNNVLTKGTPTAPPFSTVQLFVLGNVSASLMNEGDIYSLIIGGDTISYTIPSATQTVGQFYSQLYLAILAYQSANPSSDWNNVAGSFGSSGNQFWLNLNRTDSATINLGISYSPFGTKQVSSVSYFVSPNASPPLVGTNLSFSDGIDTITYQVQQGDGLGDALQGLYDNLQTFITANPLSDLATYYTYSLGYNVIIVTSVLGNYPFVFTSSVDPTTSPQLTFSGEKCTVSQVCNCTQKVSIDVDVDYATAVITTTDTTNYGAYVSLTRSHTIYPPPISGLPSQTTSATTNVYTNIVTTTWSVQIESTIVTLKANDTYITCEVSGSKEFLVEADTLCKTLCVLKTYRADLFKKFGKVNTAEMERAWSLAMDEYVLAIQATRCGRPQSEVQGYIDKAYAILGLDPTCDCGCSANDNPTPVVPTSIINGTDGTDGVTPIFQNTGTWIQVSYDEGSTWNNLFSLASVTGATGATGAAGASGSDGVALLHNDISNSTTTTNTLETLKTFAMDAGQLAADGDMIEVYARFVTNAELGSALKEVYVYLGGSSILGWSLIGGRQVYCELNLKITRTSATAGKAFGSILIGQNVFLLDTSLPELFVPVSNVSAIWANALNIETRADDNGANTITNTVFQVTYYKKKQ
jgi:hypothetical protein